jgi:HD-GYP domain-containing protein (c-di-GMP phosphodiesterase class II)
VANLCISILGEKIKGTANQNGEPFMLSEKDKLESIVSLGTELNQINDLDILMERVLFKARQWVNADAGSIYISDGENLKFEYTQNDTLQGKLSEGEKLIYATFTIPINEKSIAGYVASTGQTLNLADVYSLPPDVSYHFSSKFDDTSGYKTTSILTIPLKTTNGDILGILQIINAQDESKDESKNVIPFTKDDEKMMHHFAGIASIALERAKMTRSIIMRMISMAELHDPKETGAHVNRVGSYAVEIYEKWAQRRKIPREEIDKKRDVLRMAAMLHDVGKIATSDMILKKPGPLDDDEFETMKLHTVHGARLFLDKQSEFDEASGIVALNHHERWDGSSRGYPGYIDVESGEPLEGKALDNGEALPKKGEEIHLFGRIVALADVYDALASVRSYKEAWDEEKIISILKEESGTHFDPELVEIFLEIFDTIKSIGERYSS